MSGDQPGSDVLLPRRVAMLIYPGVTPLDVAGPLQVFELCNAVSHRRLYDILTIAPAAGAVPAAAGITFLPSLPMEALELPIDTLLVAGSTDPTAGVSDDILDWLRRAAPQARRFGSICTGAFLLAAAGLLEGRRVTTHWRFAPALAALAPAARVEVDAIYVRDGRLYSSAGITAGIDLALALVEEDHGRKAALAIARILVLALKRSGGQSQFSTQLQAQMSDLPAIQKVQEWCLANLAGDLSVPVLARQAAMSERSFVRLFRRETGTSPAAYVAAQRMRIARELLEETSFPATAVARRCGLSSTALRRAFMRELGVRPNEYRSKFSGLPSPRRATFEADRNAAALRTVPHQWAEETSPGAPSEARRARARQRTPASPRPHTRAQRRDLGEFEAGGASE